MPGWAGGPAPRRSSRPEPQDRARPRRSTPGPLGQRPRAGRGRTRRRRRTANRLGFPSHGLQDEADCGSARGSPPERPALASDPLARGQEGAAARAPKRQRLSGGAGDASSRAISTRRASRAPSVALPRRGVMLPLGLQSGEAGLDTRRMTVQRVTVFAWDLESRTERDAARDALAVGLRGGLAWMVERTIAEGRAGFGMRASSRACELTVTFARDEPRRATEDDRRGREQDDHPLRRA